MPRSTHNDSSQSNKTYCGTMANLLSYLKGGQEQQEVLQRTQDRVKGSISELKKEGEQRSSARKKLKLKVKREEISGKLSAKVETWRPSVNCSRMVTTILHRSFPEQILTLKDQGIIQNLIGR